MTRELSELISVQRDNLGDPNLDSPEFKNWRVEREEGGEVYSPELSYNENRSVMI